ncbi:aminocarboxymuconate-semialdehyde decarboxylase [Sphingomonas vulcanisoli]|uniref:Aminocarboxymuconate-semialdehyde decarboxylase n=1 Tax=Sphingomonas vulcanisoli TaxID=1658060 RepID=A0ABX0TVS6_9SPHN|nr:amidohydrolase family protein [Sphingomonas vulcanisoli]NIJ09617.1 aminocarboxymuconate-semialdehyde decarboxylase [Sphingomonas vulcanisoli]
MAHDCFDVHTHFVPAEFPPYLGLGQDVPWPSMVDAKPCHKTILISGKTYRTLADGCWSAARRIEEMPSMGVTHQAISAMPELMSYWLPLDDAKVLIRYINDQLALLIDEDRSRFFGMGGVPLQDVDTAIDELRYVVEKLRFTGVQIASHVNGVSIGDPRFEPFFAEAERLGASIFVHALRPAGTERLVGPLPPQAVAFPADIGFAAASMITGGTGAKHPDLRIAFSHGGGALLMALPRVQEVWGSNIPGLEVALTEAPIVTARRFFYDHVVLNPALLKLVVETYGETQVLVGSDYPFYPARLVHPHADFAAAGLSEEVVALITNANPRRFLGLA